MMATSQARIRKIENMLADRQSDREFTARKAVSEFLEQDDRRREQEADACFEALCRDGVIRPAAETEKIVV